MKTNLLIIPIIALGLSACASNVQKSSSNGSDFTVDPHYCQHLKADINSNQSLNNNNKHTAITKSRLLQQYHDFGCAGDS